MKNCNKCGSSLPNTIEFFTPEKRRVDGLSEKCKSCRKDERSGSLNRRFTVPRVPVGKLRIEAVLENYEIVTESGCWIWMGPTTQKGYGDIKYKADKENKHHRAHRLSYELHEGAIPDGMLVCHSCDTPACINPNHLFVGTAQDNMDDMFHKGRDQRSKNETHIEMG